MPQSSAFVRISRRARGLLGRLAGRLRFFAPGGYRSEAYWRARHERYGFDLRGVGNKALTAAENEAMYAEARNVVLGLCRSLGVDFASASMLDVGCGTGFYASLYFEGGGTDYTGLDITDALFPELSRRFPTARFEKRDISERPLGETFDLITMIDVSQHIVVPDRFERALRHVRAALAPGGVALLTAGERHEAISWYNVLRDLPEHLAYFEGCEATPPVRFRDKLLFAVRAS